MSTPVPPRRGLSVAILLLAILATCAMTAEAQIDIRVSAKFLYASDGSGPCPGNCDVIDTDEEVMERIDWANQVLDNLGRGYRFEVTEILHLDQGRPLVPVGSECDSMPVLEWTDPHLGGFCAWDIISQAAIDSSEAFAFDETALNMYILFNSNGGYCATSSAQSGNLKGQVFIQGQSTPGNIVRPFHELLHAMTLCHTHGGGPCSSCGDDCLTDTLLDHPAWDDPDSLAIHNGLGPSYESLGDSDRQLVLNTLYNLMSYHQDADGSQSTWNCDPDIEVSTSEDDPPNYCRHLLTSDQLDKMTDRGNDLYGRSAANGLTHFVGGQVVVSSDPPGWSQNPYLTLFDALLAVEADSTPTHVIQMRSGTHFFTGEISSPMTLRASRGTAVVR